MIILLSLSFTSPNIAHTHTYLVFLRFYLLHSSTNILSVYFMSALDYPRIEGCIVWYYWVPIPSVHIYYCTLLMWILYVFKKESMWLICVYFKASHSFAPALDKSTSSKWRRPVCYFLLNHLFVGWPENITITKEDFFKCEVSISNNFLTLYKILILQICRCKLLSFKCLLHKL